MPDKESQSIPALQAKISQPIYPTRKVTGRTLSGWVRNRRDGSVEGVFSGAPEDVEAMIALAREGPHYAEVEGVEVSRDESAERSSSFEMLPTQ